MEPNKTDTPLQMADFLIGYIDTAEPPSAVLVGRWLYDWQAEAQTTLLDQNRVLLTALWTCGFVAGMDTDGDSGPGAMVAGMGQERFAQAMVSEVRELRQAYNEALLEAEAALTPEPKDERPVREWGVLRSSPRPPNPPTDEPPWCSHPLGFNEWCRRRPFHWLNAEDDGGHGSHTEPTR